MSEVHIWSAPHPAVASLAKEVYVNLPKPPSNFNGSLVKLGLTSLAKEVLGIPTRNEGCHSLLSDCNIPDTKDTGINIVISQIPKILALTLLYPRYQRYWHWHCYIPDTKDTGINIVISQIPKILALTLLYPRYQRYWHWHCYIPDTKDTGIGIVISQLPKILPLALLYPSYQRYWH